MSSDEQSRTGKRAVDEVSRREALAKLEGFNDPLRLTILTALILRPSSAADLAADLDLPIGRVRYQLGRLRKAGLAELREQRPRRGVLERVYFIRPHLVTTEEASHLTPEEIKRGHIEILKAMVGDALAALQSGTFGARDGFIVARAPLRLDEQGWEEASDLQHRTLESLLEIYAKSSRRIDDIEETSISAFAFLLLFEAAPPRGSKVRSKKSEFEPNQVAES